MAKTMRAAAVVAVDLLLLMLLQLLRHRGDRGDCGSSNGRACSGEKAGRCGSSR